MNLFLKSYKFALIFLFLFPLKSALALKYEEKNKLCLLPEIKAFDIPADFTSGLNYSIIRNSDGVIFIGKQNGVLTIDREKIFYTIIPGPVYIAGSDFANPVFFGKGCSGILRYEAGIGTGVILSESFPGKDKDFIPEGIIENDTCLIFLSSLQNYYLTKTGTNYLNKGEYHLLNNPQDWAGCISGNQYTDKNKYLIVERPNGDISLTDRSANMRNIMLPLKSKSSGRLKTVHVDPFDNTWLIFEFDLYKIEAPGGAEFTDIHQQMQEKILDAFFSGSTLYLGTTGHLLKVDPDFRTCYSVETLSPGNNTSIHLVDGAGDVVFGAGDQSLFRIAQGKTEIIQRDFFSNVIVVDENHILAGHGDLMDFSFKNGRWDILNTDFLELKTVFLEDGVIWSINSRNTILYKREDNKIRSIEIPEDAAVKIHPLNGDCLIEVNDNFFHWNGSGSELEPYSDLKNRISDQDAKSLPFYQDSTWLICQLHNSRYLVCKYYSEEEDYIPYYEIDNPLLFGALVTVLQDSSSIWLVGNKQLIRLPQVHRTSITPKAVSLQSVSLLRSGHYKKERISDKVKKIPYFKGEMLFNLSRSLMEPSSESYYRYRLNRYQENWSDWSKNYRIKLQNLHEGKYLLEIQAVSNYGQLSDPITYPFEIKAPFFRSTLAYLFYLTLLLMTTFLIYKIRLLSMKNVKTRLELQIKEKMDNILSEKEKSDRLVEDLLPKSTAEELKAQGRAKSKKFERATVLFSDIQGFTRIAEEMNPEELIDELDKFFFHFDSVVEKYNIEKIKTIGDAYMAAGGIPVKNNTNPVEVVLAGLEMQQYMKELKKTKINIWDLRIGIHTGPVISGVVGHKKMSYDIWGDTVNTASRMESSGEIGKVNISGTTYSQVKEYFLCEYRGKLPVKYKGNIDMYFVIGLRPELSVDLKGIPNRRFFLKLQMLRLQDLENLLFEEILIDKISSLHFHKKEYILRVFNQTELLGRSENISEDDMLLVQTASLMLYSGLSETYDKYENRSAVIVRNILPSYSYSDRQIDRISNLILATKAPYNPQNRLEEILIDAKLEFLGRADYSTQVKLLYLELKEFLGETNKDKLIRSQEKLLYEFQYYTLAGQRLRELKPEEQILKLREWK